MLHSTYFHKETYEDPKTSAIFENLLLLPDNVFWHILRQSCYSHEDLPTNPGKLLSFDFWPHWDSKGTNNSKYVESIKIAAQLQESTKSRDIHCPAMEYGRILMEGIVTRQNLDEAISWFDVAIDLSYDIQHKSRAVYYKAKALYEQGHKLKALWCLGDTSDNDYRASELAKEIKSELNPLSGLFK